MTYGTTHIFFRWKLPITPNKNANGFAIKLPNYRGGAEVRRVADGSVCRGGPLPAWEIRRGLRRLRSRSVGLGAALTMKAVMTEDESPADEPTNGQTDGRGGEWSHAAQSRGPTPLRCQTESLSHVTAQETCQTTPTATSTTP